MKKQELGLVIKQENKINKIFNRIRMLIFLDDIRLLNSIEKLTYIKKPELKKIIVPECGKKEIKLGKKK